MTNLPTAAPTAAAPAQAAHPRWCAEEHNDDYPAHAYEVGDADLVINAERELSVTVYQFGDDPHDARVWLVERGAMTSSVTELLPDVARSLADRLSDAVDLIDGIARE